MFKTIKRWFLGFFSKKIMVITKENTIGFVKGDMQFAIDSLVYTLSANSSSSAKAVRTIVTMQLMKNIMALALTEDMEIPAASYESFKISEDEEEGDGEG